MPREFTLCLTFGAIGTLITFTGREKPLSIHPKQAAIASEVYFVGICVSASHESPNGCLDLFCKGSFYWPLEHFMPSRDSQTMWRFVSPNLHTFPV